jgi:hypothetical protein
VTPFEPDGQHPLPPRQRPSRRGRIWGAIVAVLAVAAVLVLAPWDPGRTQAMADQVTIWFSPSPAEISQLADSTGMSETGRRIFLASTPELDDAEDFNTHCPVDEQIVLGCYTAREIYLFRVTDERLRGTNEVTAAHEMLHAAYERLSDSERTHIDALIAAFVETLPPEHPLFAVLASYESDAQADELHSRLGTEIIDLTPELESYFGRYFDDRSLVLAQHAHATAAIDAANARIAELTAELDTLGADIEARRAAWDADSAELDADIQRYNDGGWTPTSDREYQELQARWEAREAARVALVADIDHYNDLVNELNDLSAASNELYQKLDSMAGAREPAQPTG